VVVRPGLRAAGAAQALAMIFWIPTIAAFVVLGVLAFRGVRWAYVAFIALGVLFFPARAGFHFDPHPCELALNVPLAVYSLGNWKHIVLFAILFLMTSVHARRHPFVIGTAMVWAFGVYVEVAEGFTGNGHCRVRDLVPDTAGALLGAAILLVIQWTRRNDHED
jgi:hypothetical protein